MVEEVALGAVEHEFDGRPAEGSTAALGSESSVEVEHHTGEKVTTANAGADVGDVSFDKVGKPSERHDEDPSILDAVAGVITAPDPRAFLGGMIGALSQRTFEPVRDESSIGTILRQLGHALGEDLDEELAFQNVTDALDRKQLPSEALHRSAPIVAAFLARIVSLPLLRISSDATPAEIESLVRAATQVAREALENRGARGWRTLPAIAATIARRAALRGLSVDALAEALPRLWARLGLGPREASAPGSDRFQGRTKGEPRRMVLRGPVEIVILER